MSWSQQSEKWGEKMITDFFEKRVFCSEHQPKREDVMKADENRLFFFFRSRNKTLRLHITSPFITMAADKTTTGYHYSNKMNSFMQKENSRALISCPSSPLPPSLLPYLVNQKAQCSFAFCKKSFYDFATKKKKQQQLETVFPRQSICRVPRKTLQCQTHSGSKC